MSSWQNWSSLDDAAVRCVSETVEEDIRGPYASDISIIHGDMMASTISLPLNVGPMFAVVAVFEEQTGVDAGKSTSTTSVRLAWRGMVGDR